MSLSLGKKSGRLRVIGSFSNWKGQLVLRLLGQGDDNSDKGGREAGWAAAAIQVTRGGSMDQSTGRGHGSKVGLIEQRWLWSGHCWQRAQLWVPEGSRGL
jgi:hypothetical protein